ncbi:unnamed protein product (mitochondrion) [Plasmodiophora brassicae]|uniref:Pentacotripeptide-repeat region of PRORP domain-containing protein n=1 Tax=Plasmodiophora brassicae TaxID=37360 RepID=A0A0G4IQN2_PLABS|nr:hypothetical protein PBRA_000791 [Plasmodiophora brassicae]SPQ97759.1 unnamed protein product [Plasmodiophora brassicae]
MRRVLRQLLRPGGSHRPQRCRFLSAGPDLQQELQRELGYLTSSFHDIQKEIASAQYIARYNPHGHKARERAGTAQTRLEHLHDQFQMVLQREGHRDITRAEICLDAYKKLFEARIWHYNVLMDSFRRHSPGQCNAMLARIDREDITPDTEFFNIWLDALAKMDASLPAMQSVLDEMQKREVEPDRYTHSTMLEVLAANGEVQLVDATIESMLGDAISPTPNALAKVMTLYGDVGIFDKADSIRDSLLQAEESSYSMATFTALMRYSIRRRHRDVVEKIWELVDQKQTRPAPDVFDSYVAWLFEGETDNWDERKEKLNRVLARALAGGVRLTLRPVLPYLHELLRDYIGRNEILTMILSAAAHANFPANEAVMKALRDWFYEYGDLDQLIVVFETMEKVGLSPQSLGYSIIQKCAQSNPSGCHALIRYMVARGIPVYREAFATVIFAGSNRADLECCDEMASIMKDLGMVPTAASLNAHLTAAIQANSVVRIDELFDESRRLGYELNVDNAQYLLVASSARGQLEACTYLFDMLKQGGKRTPSSLEYDSMVAVIVKSGDPHRALGLIREMRTVAGHAPSFTLLHDVVKVFVARGLLDDAQHLVEELSRDNLADFITTCSSLIEALAGRGELERCERICALLEEAGGFPRPAAISSMIVAFGNVGMVEIAEQLFSLLMQRSPPERCMINAYNAMLHVLARNAMFDECGRMIGEFQSRGIPMEFYVFRALVTSFAFRGRLDECEATYLHFSSSYRKSMETVFAWLATPYGRANALARLQEFAERVAATPEQAARFLDAVREGQNKMLRRASINRTLARQPAL